MSLKTRIEKLESPIEDSKIPNVILIKGVSPGDEPDRKVIGWRVNGIEYMVKKYESYDDFADRVISEVGGRPVIAVAIHNNQCV